MNRTKKLIAIANVVSFNFMHHSLHIDSKSILIQVQHFVTTVAPFFMDFSIKDSNAKVCKFLKMESLVFSSVSNGIPPLDLLPES